MAVLLCTSASIAALALHSAADGSRQASITGVHTIPIALVHQYKDSNTQCTAGPPCTGTSPDPPHEWDHAAGPDGVFGTGDDCPHCSAYSAPASISMIASAYGRMGQLVRQDRIYDNGKSTPPEVTGDNVIQTHGVGMFDGTGVHPEEVQDALGWALGNSISVAEHDPSDPMTVPLLQDYIDTFRPVLWIGHDGWPTNQSVDYPSPSDRPYQGHVKVIAGYDDRGSSGTGDDLVLVYDPWPEYDRSSILPRNATLGPGGTYDPYWLPLRDLDLGDGSDVSLVPTVSIPEFSSVVLPVLGTLVAAVLIARARGRRDRA